MSSWGVISPVTFEIEASYVSGLKELGSIFKNFGNFARWNYN
jgi:hypothetical protein